MTLPSPSEVIGSTLRLAKNSALLGRRLFVSIEGGAGKIVCQRTIPNNKADACSCDFVMLVKIKSASETSKEGEYFMPHKVLK